MRYLIKSLLLKLIITILIIIMVDFIRTYFYYVVFPSKMATTLTVERAIYRVQFCQQYGIDGLSLNGIPLNLCTNDALSGNTSAEMGEQNIKIQKLPIEERLDFYTLLIANINLFDTSSAEVVAVLYDIFDEDLLALYPYLIEFQKSNRFDELNDKQKERFNYVKKAIKQLYENPIYINRNTDKKKAMNDCHQFGFIWNTKENSCLFR